MSKPLNTVVGLFRKARESNFSLTYHGPFMERLTHHILGISESGLNKTVTKSGLSRKISFLLVECFQNIVRHGENDEDQESELAYGLFCFNQVNGNYIINSINKVFCPICAITL